MTRLLEGPRAGSTAGIVSRLCAAISIAALLVLGSAAPAQQAAQAGATAQKPATHKATGSRHKPVPHRTTHHSSAQHRAHTAQAAHRPGGSRSTRARTALRPKVAHSSPAQKSPATADSQAAQKPAEPSPALEAAPQPSTPVPSAVAGSQAAEKPVEAAPAAAPEQQTAPATAASSGAAAQAATPAPNAQSAHQPEQPSPAQEPAQQPSAPVTTSQAQQQAPAVTEAPSQAPAFAPAPTASASDSQSAQQPAQPSPAAEPAQQPSAQATGSQADQQAPAITEAPSTEAPSQAPVAGADQSAATPANVPAGTAPSPAPIAQATDFDISKLSTVTEEELRRLLVGKSLYLRGGYLDNSLTFGENGQLIGHSPQGSYTLSCIQIDRVRLSKHKVELEGARYGLHFLGSMPYEDPTKAVDRVKITPKKKVVKITIDRELVVTPKKKKEKDQDKGAKGKIGPGGLIIPAEPAADTPGAADDKAANAEPAGTQPAAASPEASDEEQAKAEMAAAPEEERPADPGSITTTTSPAHAAKVLKDALDKVFAPGLDDRMMAGMPDFWKLYYQAAAARTDYRPKDSTVLRQSAVDEKAKLLSTFQPESNDFAQDAGVAGMSLYHTVIGADGKPGEIAVARPIGFGLDENAVAAIRKASFQPAMKDGKPVPVILDLVVQFRIYSKRTNVASKPDDPNKPHGPLLPGPYTLRDPGISPAAPPQAQ